jgi:hypothetical protein
MGWSRICRFVQDSTKPRSIVFPHTLHHDCRCARAFVVCRAGRARSNHNRQHDRSFRLPLRPVDKPSSLPLSMGPGGIRSRRRFRSSVGARARDACNPVQIKQGFENRDDWKNLVGPVNEHWVPVVRGDRSKEEGLAALARVHGPIDRHQPSGLRCRQKQTWL